MTHQIRTRFGLAMLGALLAGFALAQLPGGCSLLPTQDRNHNDNHNYDHNYDHDGVHRHGEAPGREDAEHSEDTVVLTARQIEASGIRIVPVGRGGGHESRLAGWVQPVADARVVAATSVGGRIERVLVDTGARVEAGELLAVVASGEGAALRAAAEAAAAEAEAARLAFARDLALVDQGVVARQELEASKARSRSADAAARAAEAQWVAAGSPDARGHVAIHGPIAGIVGGVRVSPGAVVTAGSVVAEIVDPERTELVFSTTATLATQLAPGARLDVVGSAVSFEAVVVGVASGERGGSSIVRARAEPGILPATGSPVTAAVVTGLQADGLTVPADAVQTLAGRPVVFVATSAGFRATPVLTGRRAGDRVEILRGLSGAERVVGANAFLLKAELAKGEAGHDH